MSPLRLRSAPHYANEINSKLKIMSENISNNNQNQKDIEHSSEREYGNGRSLSSPSRFIMIRKLETGSRYKDGNLKLHMVN